MATPLDDRATFAARPERDVLALAKTVAANEFPVERPSVVGVDRETGRLVRLAPFPWKGNDTDPPIAKWSWVVESVWAGSGVAVTGEGVRSISGNTSTRTVSASNWVSVARKRSA